MMTHTPETVRPHRWWLEKEILWLVLIVVLAQVIRLGALSLRGEESRRALIGVEMLQTGDWLVPTQQHHPVYFRPPLQNWAIAVSTLICGECNAWAARLPSVLALLAMTVILYGYGRSFLSRTGALATAIAYPTMAEVLQLSGQAETEAMFTLFIGTSLMIWHWGYTCGWSETATWVGAYILVALGALTKGTQAPIYFFATVCLFLIWQRDWRRLFSWGHLLGLAALAIVMSLWLLPYGLRMGLPATLEIMGGEASDRFHMRDVSKFVKHVLCFPLETFGCMLPWSLLLFGYCRKEIRSAIGPARSHVLYFTIAVVISYPTVWFAIDAMTRYWMPMYPCLCPLIGLVVERTWQTSGSAGSRRWWSLYLGTIGLALVAVLGVALAGSAHLLPGSWGLQLPVWQVVLFAGFMSVFLVLLFRNLKRYQEDAVKRAVFALGGCMSVCFAFVFLTVLINRSVTTEASVTKVKQIVADEKLVSLGKVHHLFVFHYQKPVPRIDWPKSEQELPPDVEYFCFDVCCNQHRKIPFAWEPVAVVNCDRTLREAPFDQVIVARRIPPTLTQQRQKKRTSQD